MASVSPILATRPGPDRLEAQLRAMFRELACGPTPAHLLDIVDQLEAQSRPVSRPARRADALIPA